MPCPLRIESGHVTGLCEAALMRGPCQAGVGDQLVGKLLLPGFGDTDFARKASFENERCQAIGVERGGRSPHPRLELPSGYKVVSAR